MISCRLFSLAWGAPKMLSTSGTGGSGGGLAAAGPAAGTRAAGGAACAGGATERVAGGGGGAGWRGTAGDEAGALAWRGTPGAEAGARVPARAAPVAPTITGERCMTTPSAEAMLTYWRGATRGGVGVRGCAAGGFSTTTG
jgi:hypothetical protein